MTLLTRLRCLFCRHTVTLPTREGDRIFLSCQHCGHESAGWTLDAPAPVRRF
jgi:ribosomal protein L37AE/L43A